ncbi:O-antigen ligase family protein [Candidatus Poribacteria bacterium]|nr:O-antigen ligase family protein [Candidatus Poribacteria bacterium]
MSRAKKKRRIESGPGNAPLPLSPARDLIYTWADNLLFSGVLLILFLRPFVDGRTYPHYNHFFHIGVGLLALLWLVKSMRTGRLELHNRLVTGFMLAFLFVCSLTFFTSINRGLTLRYIFEMLSYTLIYLVIANNFREASSVRVAVACILVSALVVNIYGLFQRYYTLEMTRKIIEDAVKSGNQDLLSGVPLGYGILNRLESTRVFSTFLFPNAYAMFLGLAGSLTIGWLWSMGKPMTEFTRSCLVGVSAKKVADSNPENVSRGVTHLLKAAGGLLLVFLFLVSCVLIPWDLWLTYSRGGWLTAVVVVAVFLVVRFQKKNPPSPGTVLVIFLLALLAASVVTPDAVCEELMRVRHASILERIRDSKTVLQRLSYWKAGLGMIRENMWLGVGWGAFEKAYPRYMILGGYPVKLAHNNYLQVWAETGIIGLNAFIGLWLVFLYTFWRKAWSYSVGDLRGIACGLGAGIVGFLAQSLTDFSLYLPTLAYFIFAMVGLLVAIPDSESEEDKFSIRFPSKAGVVCIAVVAIYLVFLYRSFVGLNLYVRVEAERNKAFPTELARRQGFKADPRMQHAVLRNSLVLLKRSVRYFPLDSDSHHMLGDSYLRLAQSEGAPSLLVDAIKELERAGALDPWSPYVFQSLAVAYWVAGNSKTEPGLFRKALQAELQASRNFPVNPEFHDRLVQIYKALGMEKEAGAEAALSAELQKHYKEF